MKLKYITLIAMFLLLASGQVFAQQYDKGLYKWKAKEGELTLVAAKMNRQDVIAGVFKKYFFYLNVPKDGVYEVPFLKTSDLGGDYQDSLVASGDGENVWTDADVVQKKGDLFVYYAYKNSKHNSESGSITVVIYKLFEGDAGSWIYGFKVEKNIKYALDKNLTVPEAIKKTELIN